MANIIEEYECHFDPIAYAHVFVSESDYEWKTKVEEFFHHIFYEKRIPGSCQLDVGSGATFRSVISSSAYITEIYTSDLLVKARKEAEKWLRGDPDALDYTWAFKLVAQLEKHNDHKKLEARVRQAVKGVLPCNVLLDNPLHPRQATFDVVTSSYCLECIDDRVDYMKAIKNITSLIRPGGHLALITVTNLTKYTLGGHQFSGSNMDAETIHEIITKAGMKILESQQYPHQPSFDLYDGAGILTILAQKDIK